MTKILIVEDEPGISGFLKKGLEEEGYAIDIAATGNEGLKRALSHSYDLLLLDWMLPGLSGLDICTRVREQDKTTPIIFITAKDTIQETIAGLRSGANDYIKKPFHFEELLERIRVQLRHTEGEVNEYQLGDISINKLAHKVFRAGHEVALTQKEFSLLEYLVKNKGRICTRTQIIEDVWNISFEYDTGVIDVFMNSLRKKLNLKKDEDYIRTIRGIGYIADEIG
ncbi:DNA-binding response regulator [Flavobacterium magnum]|uniref:DNA-binding response regulator n=1 Tax=Flavobacterium magnum TaxID=2162713 RepID=A0A2S0RF51_9FLAO|nr:response regulator transcription factor [Flavobacterium magnum]AWA30567.1 DNA-binding response regulator [Flavobacterium magnum]